MCAVDRMARPRVRGCNRDGSGTPSACAASAVGVPVARRGRWVEGMGGQGNGVQRMETRSRVRDGCGARDGCVVLPKSEGRKGAGWLVGSGLSATMCTAHTSHELSYGCAHR